MSIERGLRIENENLKRLLEETERERDEFERAYRSLFNKRSLRVHDLQKSLWKEMDKRCFPGAYMQIVCDKILEYGCAEVADLKKQIERITRDRDEALALNERLRGALNLLIWQAEQVDGWEQFPSAWIDAAQSFAEEQPPAALAALKAEWQAENIECMIDNAMIEMRNMHPRMRRSDCKRLILAAIRTQETGDE